MRTILALLALATPSFADDVKPDPAERVGTVLGKPVLRGDLDGKSPAAVFLVPVLEKYKQDHAEEITPTDAEIDAATNHYDAAHAARMKKQEPELKKRLEEIERELNRDDLTEEQRKRLEIEKLGIGQRRKPPGRGFARFALANWKFQKHLHDKHDGGRLLFQQAGVEAFDATRRWLEEREKQGDFTVTDPELRRKVYHYWTRDHGPFLIDDEEQIAKFLEPEWLESRDQESGDRDQ